MLPVVLLPLIGCGGGDAPATARLRAVPGSGIEVGTTPLVRIQPADGEGGFTDVRGIRFLPDGGIVFADASVPVVYVHGHSGALERTLGRAGEGPWEFRSPQVIGTLDDTILVFDLRARKVNRFTRTDGFVSAITLTGLPGTLSFLRTLSTDHLLLKRITFPEGEGGVELRPAQGQLLEVQLSTGAVDTLASGDDGVYVRGFRWFNWQLASAADDSVIWFGRSDRAELHRYDRRSRTTEHFAWKGSARLVTEEDRRDAREFATSMGAAPEMTSPDRFADSVPVFGSLLVDPTGSVWVLSYARPMSTPDSAWVVDPRAGTIGALRLPPRFRPTEIGADRVLGLLLDEDGIPTPAVFGLTRTPAADR